jgi:hypothetical protein
LVLWRWMFSLSLSLSLSPLCRLMSTSSWFQLLLSLQVAVS